MQNTIKRYFPIPYVAALFIGGFYCLYQLVASAGQLAWIGASVAVVPMMLLFAYIATGLTARSRRYSPWQLGAAVLGSVLVAFDFTLYAAVLAWGLGLVLGFIYVFWFVPMDRSESRIELGRVLPAASFVDINGNTVTTQSTGKPQLWLFIRGNWCPFCVAQVKELAAAYQELADLGAEVFMVSPQSQQQSQKLAAKLNVPMQFLVDDQAQGAKDLGIQHTAGVPVGLPGDFDEDSVMPTVVITNSEGSVIYADQTNDYRVRPEPALFVQVLKNAQKPISA
ncbi:MAG: redoxin domain-containing protein [Pseudomonadales bacterium]|nr:redoxin domain-containing protein [Pseudomonadales bacterium]